jgi:thiosulfate reductase cytochrome b subunit
MHQAMAPLIVLFALLVLMQILLVYHPAIHALEEVLKIFKVKRPVHFVLLERQTLC